MPREPAQGSGTIRTFIAIELPANVKDLIDNHVERLKALAPTGIKWVDTQTAHLTLAFLGNVDETLLPALSQMLDGVAVASPKFKLATGQLGAFFKSGKPRVLWLGMEGDVRSLDQAQIRLQHALADKGFPREKRSFKPHITLGRARGKGSLSLPEGALHFPTGVGAEFEVREIVLMSSVLTSHGPVHTRLHVTPLPTS